MEPEATVFAVIDKFLAVKTVNIISVRTYKPPKDVRSEMTVQSFLFTESKAAKPLFGLDVIIGSFPGIYHAALL